MKSLYLLLDILTISFPLARSFEPKIHFYSRWKPLFIAIGISGGFFLVWDVIFTDIGVWSFNERYLTGLKIINLPVEEWLFFIAVPFACMFIYEVLNYFVKQDILGSIAIPASLGVALILLVTGLFNLDKLYTSVTFILTATMLLIQAFMIKGAYLGRFYLAYLVSLFPFIMVNGLLTGSLLAEPVVRYNNQENLSVRLFTIPIEDTAYLLLLLLMTVSIYESLKQK